MLRSFLLPISLLCICTGNMDGIRPTMQGNIVGGIQASIEKFPYTAQIYNVAFFCGGAILTSWCVMTAAHCFMENKNTKHMQVHVGSRHTFDINAAKHTVWYVVVHQDYNKAAPFACDIALVFVTRPIQLSNKVQKAVLVNSNNWMSKTKENFTASGWGWISYGGPMSPSGLLEVGLQFMPSQQCRELGEVLSADMFCLYGDGERDTCKGDSGGAILWKGLVVGLVSHGKGCARKNAPGVYTSVHYFRSWIKTKILECRKKYCIFPPF